MKTVSIGLLIYISFFISGCGTVMHGKKQKIYFSTDPQGAIVKVGGFKIQTPSLVILDRSQNYTATVQMEGYEEKKIPIQKQFDFLASGLGNIPTGGLGLILDFYTQSAYTLKPDEITTSLKKTDYTLP